MFQGILKNSATAVLCVGLCDCVGEYFGVRMTLTKGVILVGIASYILTEDFPDRDLVLEPDYRFNALDAHIQAAVSLST